MVRRDPVSTLEGRLNPPLHCSDTTSMREASPVMSRSRDEVLEWAEQGRIAPGRLRAALDVSGALPTLAEWRAFLDRLLLWTGAVFLAAAVIYFIAYNWSALGRFGKLAIPQVAVAVALGFVWRLGLDRSVGRAALLAASLLVGAVFALIGQTYQTGADTFELFATWAVAILPWVLLGRFAALWLTWLAIVHLAVALWFLAFPGWFGILFAHERQLWLHLVLATAALAAWEWRAARGITWLRERWAVRTLAAASVGFATALAIADVFARESGFGWGQIGWLAWLAGAYFVYRRQIRDLFVLAAAVLSVIVVVAALSTRHMSSFAAEAYLFVGIVVIGLSALGGWWLRRIAQEEGA